MDQWEMAGSDTDSVFRIVFRTPRVQVGYRDIGLHGIRVRIQLIGCEFGDTGKSLPAPFAKASERHASCVVACADGRVAMHRALDWCVKFNGHEAGLCYEAAATAAE